MRVHGGNDKVSVVGELDYVIAVMPWTQVSGIDNVRMMQDRDWNLA